MDIDTDPEWLELQLQADAAVATDTLIKHGSAACDDYLAGVNYHARLERLRQLQAGGRA